MTEKWRNFLFHPTGCTMGCNTFLKTVSITYIKATSENILFHFET